MIEGLVHEVVAPVVAGLDLVLSGLGQGAGSSPDT